MPARYEERDWQQFVQDAFMRLISRDSAKYPLSPQELATLVRQACDAARLYFPSWELELAALRKRDSEEREARIQREIADDARKRVEAAQASEAKKPASQPAQTPGNSIPDIAAQIAAQVEAIATQAKPAPATRQRVTGKPKRKAAHR
jgi:hypothetical protein